MSTQGILVGKVVGLFRYPVKAMAAEPLEEAEVSWFGIAGDRRWAFIREAATGSGFPWLTIRQRSDMMLYQPRLVDPSRPDHSPVEIASPTGETFDMTDSRLAAELFPDEGGRGVHSIKQSRGIFDTFPLSLITTHTIKQLGDSIGRELDVFRFRPNFLVEAMGDAKFPEDQWVGRVLRMGTMRMRIDKRDGRCVVINVDPSTGQPDSKNEPNILKAVVAERDGCLGVYGTPVAPGRILINDNVYLEPQHS